MITVLLILVLAAFVCVIAAAVWSRVPLWVAVVLLCMVELLRVLPVGR